MVVQNVSLNEKVNHRLSMEKNLRKALENQEFFLLYQPKIATETKKITGLEALIRWKHNDKIIPPSEFIEILEDTNLILHVGDWVVEECCIQAKTLKEEFGYEIPIAINVSAKQFNSNTFIGKVEKILEKYKLPPHLIEFEITESILMEDTKETIKTMNQLMTMSIPLSIDDFGTGYSSLAYLKRFPVKTIKIDRGFIRDIELDEDDTIIVKAIVSMAHNLKLSVVAEGVENEKQYDYLKSIGCDTIQGYLFSKPIHINNVQEIIKYKNGIIEL